jgi:hypothetical protein
MTSCRKATQKGRQNTADLHAIFLFERGTGSGRRVQYRVATGAYRMADTSEEHQGGCLCGAVRYRFHGAPDWSAHCHCRSCQKATGAAFTTWVGVKKGSFDIIKGQLAVCNSSPGVERSFCGRCGTSLTYVAEQRWPGQISILAPTLDDPGIAVPTAHVYVQDRLPWVKLADGLPAHEEY